jgi:glycosyltransferase involved in cell wall biosynthesis
VLDEESFRIHEVPVTRPNDVNRHAYSDPTRIRRIIADVEPDVIDVHEEPFSAAMHQLQPLVPADIPIVAYTAQNADKRYPPPFTRWERSAFERVGALYPCSRQAASVARGRGYNGQIRVLPLGFDPDVFRFGDQRHDDDVWTLAMVGRLVPEKGVMDALAAFAAVRETRDCRLVVAGQGPLADEVLAAAQALRVGDAVTLHPWMSSEQVAALYRMSHVVLVPSRATDRWVEQFGRIIVEAQASGAVVAGYASGSIPEVCQGAGLLSAEGDVVGLTRACVDIASLPQTWTALRDAGIANSAGMSWQHVAEAQLALYAKAQSEPAPPTPGQRSTALEEFGAPARLRNGQARPFALPLLRSLGPRRP